MMLSEQYVNEICKQLRQVMKSQGEKIQRASEIIAESIMKDGVFMSSVLVTLLQLNWGPSGSSGRTCAQCQWYRLSLLS